jgi:2-polyprenyl-6-methoxyphenol hydroxylase-like FAD-dependent oxidoreductase
VPKARSRGVVIVGAGPTGLILASELALAGVPCLVLERRDGPRQDSRAICVHARTMECLDLRGQAGPFAGAGLAVASFPLGPRGARINFRVLDSDFPYMLDIPQSQIECLLLDQAVRLGAEVRWSATVTAVAQDDDGVTVTLADGHVERAAYVVGCDGAHSFVRNAATIPFPGIHNPGSVILADLRLAGLPMDAAYGDLSRAGMLLVFPFRDGTCRVVLYDYARADVPVTEPVTLEEVTASLRRVVGQDFSPSALTWTRRYRSESRQATTYRRGRVLLAGDAAHAHSPAGAQGMNTGLQDAVNLGWKLAAALAGWAPAWLLDTYQEERHPVGAGVLALSGRQFRLNTMRSPGGRAFRWAVHRLIVPLPPVQSRLARDYSGLSIRYPPGPAAHPLAGTRLPRGTITPDGAPPARLYDLFRPGRFVLLDRISGPAAEPGARTAENPPPGRRTEAPGSGPPSTGAREPGTTGPGVPGANAAGPGVAGAGAAGPGVTGAGAAGPGVTGAGAAGPGATGPGATSPGAAGTGAPGPGVAGPGAAEAGAPGPGAAGTGATGLGAAGAGVTGPGVAGAGAAGAGLTSAGLTDVGSEAEVSGPEGVARGASGASDLSGYALDDRVTVVRYRDATATGLPAAVLVRPDGYLAWASDEPDPVVRAAAARAAVRLWCGPDAS